MDINLAAFQEPRGVMRLFQFIFAICAFSTTTSYSGILDYYCGSSKLRSSEFSYPFRLTEKYTFSCAGANTTATFYGDFSSDSKFYVTTGVLAMLYCIAIIVVYVKFDDKYKSNAQWPLIDFVLTVVLAVLWLSGSGAWANGLTGLKNLVSQEVPGCSTCKIHASSFSSLNISLILGFLNFFLWASDLWFIYKETEWFQQKQSAPPVSPTV